MGSPISPTVASLYMVEFEAKALSTAPHTPCMWKRFVNDIFVVIKAVHKDEFLEHINSIDESIQFTAENTKADGSMPFLDTLVIPQSDGSLMTTVYRRPTHTDQYLQWDSHHAISTKYSVISTLYHRVKAVCSNQQQLHEEEEDLQKVLTRCKYIELAINRMKSKINAPITSNNNNNSKKKSTNSNISNTKRNYIFVPYVKGLSESYKNVCKKYGIQVYFKGGRTIKDLLVALKGKDHITKKSGIRYRYKCGRVECNNNS